jgi:hypothetical protein
MCINVVLYSLWFAACSNDGQCNIITTLQTCIHKDFSRSWQNTLVTEKKISISRHIIHFTRHLVTVTVPTVHMWLPSLLSYHRRWSSNHTSLIKFQYIHVQYLQVLICQWLIPAKATMWSTWNVPALEFLWTTITNQVCLVFPQTLKIDACVIWIFLALGGLVATCLPLDPRFADWNPAEDDEILRAIKIHCTTSIEGEVSSRPHVIRFYGILNNSTGVKEVPRRQNSVAIFRHISSASLLDVSDGNCQRALVDESGLIRN